MPEKKKLGVKKLQDIAEKLPYHRVKIQQLPAEKKLSGALKKGVSFRKQRNKRTHKMFKRDKTQRSLMWCSAVALPT